MIRLTAVVAACGWLVCILLWLIISLEIIRLPRHNKPLLIGAIRISCPDTTAATRRLPRSSREAVMWSRVGWPAGDEASVWDDAVVQTSPPCLTVVLFSSDLRRRWTENSNNIVWQSDYRRRGPSCVLSTSALPVCWPGLLPYHFLLLVLQKSLRVSNRCRSHHYFRAAGLKLVKI